MADEPTPRDVDDKWQMYVDGLVTREELDRWREERGLHGDYLERAEIAGGPATAFQHNEDRHASRTWRNRMLDGRQTVEVTCACGIAGFLTDHGVGEGGAVTPSFVHGGCGFHEHIELEGYVV